MAPFIESAKDKIENHYIFIPHDKNMLIEALKVYSEFKIDSVDSLIFAYSKIGGHTAFTFDKKLNQLLDELGNAKSNRLLTKCDCTREKPVFYLYGQNVIQ